MAVLARAQLSVVTPTDEELADAAASGDDDAFAQLHQRWCGPIHDYLARMTRNRDDAAELTQVTFEKAWRNLARRQKDRGVRPWLYAIARNSALDAMRRRRPTQALDDEEWAKAPGAAPDPEAAAVAKDSAADVWAAAAALSPTEYTVLHYELRAGMGPEDIAAATGMRTGAVYTALSRAKASFGEAFTVLQLARHGRRDCPVLNDLLGDDTLQQLTKAVRKTVRDHLRECERCRANSLRLVAPAEVFASLGLVVPRALRPLRKPDEREPPQAEPSDRRRRARQVAAIAALVAILIWVGILARAEEVAAGPDRTPPDDPAELRSPSHVLGVPSGERTAVVAWSAGVDPSVKGERTSGVAGYSVAWTNEARSLPDASIDVAAGAGLASAPITPGRPTWFHLRTADRAGNWTSTRHLGPFLFPLATSSPTPPRAGPSPPASAPVAAEPLGPTTTSPAAPPSAPPPAAAPSPVGMTATNTAPEAPPDSTVPTTTPPTTPPPAPATSTTTEPPEPPPTTEPPPTQPPPTTVPPPTQPPPTTVPPPTQPPPTQPPPHPPPP